MALISGFVYLREDQFTYTLLGVAVVLLSARVVGRVFERLHQPRVIGEVLAGLLLGPSVLGHYSTVLYPVNDRPLLKMLSTLSLVVFMFLIGLELELDHVGTRGRRVATGVAVSGTVVPFGLGVVLALALPLPASTHFLAFALFMGAAMSITAFPVLARILVERKLYDRPLGALTMAAAAGDDILTWVTLAVVVGVVAASGWWDLPYICSLGTLFAVVMIKIVRPQLNRFKDSDLEASGLTLVILGIFISSFFTSAIGLHEIFGAFLMGAVFPRGRLARQLQDQLRPVGGVLLPIFFATTGLSVQIRTVGLSGLWMFGLILSVACAGKLLGTIAGSRPLGLGTRESVGLGVLMNTRGLTELVVLNIGLERHVIDGRLFTLLVMMAVVTTVATGPLLSLVKPDPELGMAPVASSAPQEVSADGLIDLRDAPTPTTPARPLPAPIVPLPSVAHAASRGRDDPVTVTRRSYALGEPHRRRAE